MPTPLQKVEGVKAFLKRELRWIRVEIVSLCQKYGASSWNEMDELIIQDKVEEGKILEDFQRVDHLTAKGQMIEKLLEKF